MFSDEYVIIFRRRVCMTAPVEPKIADMEMIIIIMGESWLSCMKLAMRRNKGSLTIVRAIKVTGQERPSEMEINHW